MDLMKQTRGLAENRPSLSSGQLGIDMDTGKEALWVGTQNGNILLAQAGQGNWYNGITINIFGDSISIAGKWPDLMKEKYGVNINNYSYSGARLSGIGGWANQLSSIADNDAQINIIFCGTNDYNDGVEIGTRFDNEYTTLFGALNLANTTLMNKWPNATNYFISALKRSQDATTYVWGLELYNYLAYSMSKFWNNQFIDLYNNLQFAAPNISVLRNRWMSDGLHPDDSLNPFICDTIAYRIFNKLSDAKAEDQSLYTLTNNISSSIPGATLAYSCRIYTDATAEIKFQVTNAVVGSTGDKEIITGIPDFMIPVNSVQLATCGYLESGSNLQPLGSYVSNGTLKISINTAKTYTSIWGSTRYQANGLL